ncbi:bestrophin-like domain [Mycobacterium sp. C3-094]
MSQWLVTHVPSWLLLILIVAATAGLAVVIQTLVRRRFPGTRDEEHNDVTKFAFGVVGFVFAFFIGFVVSAMWGQISHADSVVRTEGAAGAQLARDSGVFDEPDRDRIRQSLMAYERAALAEWDESNAGRLYPAADEALNRLYSAYESATPRTDAQKTLLSTSFGNLNDMSKARTERVLQARTDTGPPWSLWAVIFVTSGLLLGCAIIYGVEKPANHYAMVAIIGTLVGAQLFLVVELSHPYVGAVSTVSDPLQQVIGILEQAR